MIDNVVVNTLSVGVLSAGVFSPIVTTPRHDNLAIDSQDFSMIPGDGTKWVSYEFFHNTLWVNAGKQVAQLRDMHACCPLYIANEFRKSFGIPGSVGQSFS